VVTAGLLILARLVPRLAPGHVVDEHLLDMGMGRPATSGRAATTPVEARFNVRG
jgi:hypothetical protein